VAAHAEVKRDYGDVLLMKYVLAELALDLRARLHVFSSHGRTHSRTSVLQGSQLWRLLTVIFTCAQNPQPIANFLLAGIPFFKARPGAVLCPVVCPNVLVHLREIQTHLVASLQWWPLRGRTLACTAEHAVPS
jgi:hypothetical protein